MYRSVFLTITFLRPNSHFWKVQCQDSRFRKTKRRFKNYRRRFKILKRRLCGTPSDTFFRRIFLRFGRGAHRYFFPISLFHLCKFPYFCVRKLKHRPDDTAPPAVPLPVVVAASRGNALCGIGPRRPAALVRLERPARPQGGFRRRHRVAYPSGRIGTGTCCG